MTMLTSTFRLLDEKKHSVRYELVPSIGDNVKDVATSVYITKAALPKPFPQLVRLTLEPL